MNISRGRLYSLLLLLSAGGYLWLLTTRAVRAVFQGEWLQSLYYNPLGILLVVLMVVVPVWIVIDLLKGSSSFLHAYRLIEKKLQRWPYAIIGILAILINWIWNLVKYT